MLKNAVPQALAAAGVDPRRVIGIATDFTACTMVPTTDDGTPLCELAEFVDRPHAYVKLWRHHAAQSQADRINELAAERHEPWLPRYGGFISSEWEFAKGLELLEGDPEIYQRMSHWVEAADWIVWQLGGSYVRNACSAGYKGILQDDQYPDAAFLAALNPDFAGFVGDKLEHQIGQLGQRAGRLTAQAAAWTGLPAGIAVAVGNVDAHVSAPAAASIAPGQLVAIMGTSTCHVMNGTELREVPGMCGVVQGGITEGLWGYEAGQSGVGDIFGWFVRTGVPAEYEQRAAALGVSVHEYLTELAARQRIGEHGLLALDWHSGNRSVLVDHELSGLVVGQTLATKPEDTYRALLEATAFGTRMIIETFTAAGVPVTELVIVGGLTKNALLMQIYSDVTGLPLSLAASSQGPALGSAIHAAVAAGAYRDRAGRGRSDGSANRQRLPSDCGEFCCLRRYVRRIPAPARLFRPRREPGHAQPAEPSARSHQAGVASMTLTQETREHIARLRIEVSALHAELIRWNLVVWTAGNVSARVPGADLLVVKPSGVDYDKLTPENMVVTDFDGVVVEGDAAPSSDTFAAGYVYAHLDWVGGVVHTHSTYATAFAARREPIPCVLTMMADEFGGEIPVGPFAMIGDDSIGRGIVDTLQHSRSKAVLMANHGPFTIGSTARAAVKAAAMCEEVARTVTIARQGGAAA